LHSRFRRRATICESWWEARHKKRRTKKKIKGKRSPRNLKREKVQKLIKGGLKSVIRNVKLRTRPLWEKRRKKPKEAMGFQQRKRLKGNCWRDKPLVRRRVAGKNHPLNAFIIKVVGNEKGVP